MLERAADTGGKSGIGGTSASDWRVERSLSYWKRKKVGLYDQGQNKHYHQEKESLANKITCALRSGEKP